MLIFQLIAIVSGQSQEVQNYLMDLNYLLCYLADLKLSSNWIVWTLIYQRSFRYLRRKFIHFPRSNCTTSDNDSIYQKYFHSTYDNGDCVLQCPMYKLNIEKVEIPICHQASRFSNDRIIGPPRMITSCSSVYLVHGKVYTTKTKI